jgi:D-proline reductase (dithiol) PrdB
MNMMRLKNRVVAKMITKYHSLATHFVDSYEPVKSVDVPWTPVRKLLRDSKVAMVTTAGVHHRGQKPYNMTDPDGDPTFREIDVRKPLSDLMITHDYYDHADADKDINIVFPVERLREFESEGIIDKMADIHYGFMGHIDGRHIDSLIHEQAPEIARRLKADNVDTVILTPG